MENCKREKDFDGKAYFFECCKEMRVDAKQLFKIGVGKRKTDGHVSYRCPAASRQGKGYIFAIQYLYLDKLYVAWDLRKTSRDKSDVFYLNRNSIIDDDNRMIKTVYKERHIIGRPIEEVYVFGTDSVRDFLLRTIKSEEEID